MTYRGQFQAWHFRARVCLLAALLCGLAAVAIGYQQTTERMQPAQKEFLAAYLVASVATSAGLNQFPPVPTGQPSRWRLTMDNMNQTQPGAVAEARRRLAEIFIYPWFAHGVVVGFFLGLIINHSQRMVLK